MSARILSFDFLSSVVGKDPTSLLFARYASLLIKKGKAEEAIAIAEDGVMANPNYVAGKIILAEAFLSTGKIDGAVMQLIESIKIEPDNSRAIRMLAQAYDQQGLSDKTEKLYSLLNHREPQSPFLKKRTISPILVPISSILGLEISERAEVATSETDAWGSSNEFSSDEATIVTETPIISSGIESALPSGTSELDQLMGDLGIGSTSSAPDNALSELDDAIAGLDNDSLYGTGESSNAIATAPDNSLSELDEVIAGLDNDSLHGTDDSSNEIDTIIGELNDFDSLLPGEDQATLVESPALFEEEPHDEADDLFNLDMESESTLVEHLPVPDSLLEDSENAFDDDQFSIESNEQTDRSDEFTIDTDKLEMSLDSLMEEPKSSTSSNLESLLSELESDPDFSTPDLYEETPNEKALLVEESPLGIVGTGYTPATELVDSDIEVTHDEARETFAELAAEFGNFVSSDIEQSQFSGFVEPTFETPAITEQNKSIAPALFEETETPLSEYMSAETTKSDVPRFFDEDSEPDFSQETLHTDELDISVIHAALAGEDLLNQPNNAIYAEPEDTNYDSLVSSLTESFDTLIEKHTETLPDFQFSKEPDNEPASPMTFENAEEPPVRGSHTEDQTDFHIDAALDSHLPEIASTSTGTSEFTLDAILNEPTENQMTNAEFDDFMVRSDSSDEATIVGFDFPQNVTNSDEHSIEDLIISSESPIQSPNFHADTATSDFSSDEILSILADDPETAPKSEAIRNHVAQEMSEEEEDLLFNSDLSVAETAQFSLEELQEKVNSEPEEMSEEEEDLLFNNNQSVTETAQFSREELQVTLNSDLPEFNSVEEDLLQVTHSDEHSIEDLVTSSESSIQSHQFHADTATSDYTSDEILSILAGDPDTAPQSEKLQSQVAQEMTEEEEDLLFNSDHSVAETAQFSLEELKGTTVDTFSSENESIAEISVEVEQTSPMNSTDPIRFSAEMNDEEEQFLFNSEHAVEETLEFSLDSILDDIMAEVPVIADESFDISTPPLTEMGSNNEQSLFNSDHPVEETMEFQVEDIIQDEIIPELPVSESTDIDEIIVENDDSFMFNTDHDVEETLEFTLDSVLKDSELKTEENEPATDRIDVSSLEDIIEIHHPSNEIEPSSPATHSAENESSQVDTLDLAAGILDIMESLDTDELETIQNVVDTSEFTFDEIFSTLSEPITENISTEESPAITIENSEWQEDTFDREPESEALQVNDSVSLPDHVLTPTFADIYLQQDQPRIAKQIYERLLEKEPDNDLYLERIEEIDTYIALHPESMLPRESEITDEEHEEHRTLEGKRIDPRHREKLIGHRKKKGSHE